MRVLVFEDNLVWSSRLVRSLQGLGHEPVLRTKADGQISDADAAIVNLGSSTLRPEELVPRLNAAGIHVIAHAGHKEKELHELGKTLGCDTLATNSELTYKLAALLDRVANR